MYSRILRKQKAQDVLSGKCFDQDMKKRESIQKLEKTWLAIGMASLKKPELVLRQIEIRNKINRMEQELKEGIAFEVMITNMHLKSNH